MKALYIVYVIVMVAVLALIGYFVKGEYEINSKASSCLRLELPEQDKCFSDLGRQAANLAKVAKAVTPQ
jgi:hypothetical protein